MHHSKLAPSKTISSKRKWAFSRLNMMSSSQTFSKYLSWSAHDMYDLGLLCAILFACRKVERLPKTLSSRPGVSLSPEIRAVCRNRNKVKRPETRDVWNGLPRRVNHRTRIHKRSKTSYLAVCDDWHLFFLVWGRLGIEVQFLAVTRECGIACGGGQLSLEGVICHDSGGSFTACVQCLHKHMDELQQC
eukprot:5928454-Amphidinium_carterae.2